MRFAVLVLLVGIGCASDPEPAVPTQTWQVRGIYHGPRAQGQAVSITHEAIPDEMDAMRMDFLLDPAVDVGSIAPDAPVAFTLARVDGRYVVQSVRPLPDSTVLDLPTP